MADTLSVALRLALLAVIDVASIGLLAAATYYGLGAVL